MDEAGLQTLLKRYELKNACASYGLKPNTDPGHTQTLGNTWIPLASTSISRFFTLTLKDKLKLRCGGSLVTAGIEFSFLVLCPVLLVMWSLLFALLENSAGWNWFATFLLCISIRVAWTYYNRVVENNGLLYGMCYGIRIVWNWVLNWNVWNCLLKEGYFWMFGLVY